MKERDYATNANVFRHGSLRCDEEWIIADARLPTNGGPYQNVLKALSVELLI